MSTVFAKDIIATALSAAQTTEPWSRDQMADLILSALDKAGCAVLNPQDIEWGSCPGNPVNGLDDEDGLGPHYVSLNLCSGCLEYDPD